MNKKVTWHDLASVAIGYALIVPVLGWAVCIFVKSIIEVAI